MFYHSKASNFDFSIIIIICVFTDRKKDLIKLQMGEYVALGKVEAILKTSPLVENICVCGDSTQNYCVALIVPHRENITNFSRKIGVKENKFEKLCENLVVHKAVYKDLKNYSKESKLEIDFNMFSLKNSIFHFLQKFKRLLLF